MKSLKRPVHLSNLIVMTERALVCFGTRYGSAGEIAEKIAESLRERGAQVDVVDLKKGKVKNLATYDLVVIGSGIQMGKWTKHPLKFIKKNRDTLSHKKVALFVSCMTARLPDKRDQSRRDYLDAIVEDYPEITLISMGLFGGLIDATKGNLMTKAIMKPVVKALASSEDEAPERIDSRDWDQIRLWAEGLIPDPFDNF